MTIVSKTTKYNVQFLSKLYFYDWTRQAKTSSISSEGVIK